MDTFMDTRRKKGTVHEGILTDSEIDAELCAWRSEQRT